ncbi:hypothetical protein [Acetobacter oeni]|uniref:hypothetical protein n=1 Tax=Acetobacter oeni TaxID=304077 RepID=UPI0011BE9F84|nr:hypothetical protein [Acetobacter oeni]MBB3882958.1 hypothetical protein [Acetobacter oeni]NHO19039.1 hypothetical protein [Acetobacter oeni]
MIRDVTADLNAILKQHAEVSKAFIDIISSPLLGRETLSAALGELSEHLVAAFIGGAREIRGNKGFDLIGPGNEKIEVKSRQLSKWGGSLQFNFGAHSASADEAFCIAWDDTGPPPVIHAAFRAPIPWMLEKWGCPGQNSYSIRTKLKALQQAVFCVDRVCS